MIRVALVLYLVASSAFGQAENSSDESANDFTTCEFNDIDCLAASTEAFCFKSRLGRPEFGIQPIDPYTVPELVVMDDEDSGIYVQYLNNVVTGFSNLKYTEKHLDIRNLPFPAKLVMKADFTVEGSVKVVLTENEKEFDGIYKASGTAYGTAEYILSDEERDGKSYFVVGPTTITVDFPEDPKIDFDEEYLNSLSEDPDYMKIDPSYAWDVAAVKSVVKEGFTINMNNVRSLTTVFTKKRFFKDT